MNEQQRFTLQMLQKVLELCEIAGIDIQQSIGCVGVGDSEFGWQFYSDTVDLKASDIQRYLDE